MTTGDVWRAIGAAAVIILLAGLLFTAIFGGVALLNTR